MRKQVCEQGQSRMAICAGSEAQASDLWIQREMVPLRASGDSVFPRRHADEALEDLA